ncbi:MAG: HAD superfamily hydrolase (TIGR01509 family) [Halioglobus sp.]|jgi:HAD superfamily hydrolase (TIGR01509 family)
MIDWAVIDTVLLDMDGTLLDLHFDNYFWTQYLPQEYAAKHQISKKITIDELQAKLKIEPGTLQWYCVDHWSQALDMDIAALKHGLGDMITLRPHAMEFLTRLKSSSKDVLMVTNAHRKALDLKMQRVSISHCFNRLVVSHELEAPKEQQAFWEKLQDLHPFDPKRTLLIDDTESVLRSAQKYGIAHLITLLQPDSQGQLRTGTRFPGIHHFDEIMPTPEQA